MLKGAAMGAAGTALAGGMLIEGARVDDAAASTTSAAVPSLIPFHGAVQAGITRPAPAQKFATHAALDVTATSRSELKDLFQTLTDRARFLTAGGTPPDLGVGSPPSDSDVLGPDIPSDGLTVTVSAGTTLFDDRFGLTAAKPEKLKPMLEFPNDDLDPAWCHGDLLVQICGNQIDTVHHALRDISKHTRGGLQARWKMDGFVSPPRPSGTPRNLLGFKDGIAQPSAAELNWVLPGSGEPSWAVNGSYHVVRLIRMFVEFWDRVSINEQQNMFGRYRDSGATLDSKTGDEYTPPDYSADPQGNVIPLDCHIRLANPRTKTTADQRILRRPYNYDLGYDQNGDLQAGLIFVCFQQDVERQFEEVQKRLIDEPLTDYIEPFGGGYYFALPGVRDSSDWYGRGLLA